MPYKPLKLWFDKELAEQLSEKLISVRSDFNSTSFIKKVATGVDGLELKDRVELIADELNNHLEDDYPKQVEVLLQIIGPENDEETGMFKEYYWMMPIAKFVEKYGLDHFDISMRAIEEITKRNTGEYAIRPFIEKYPEQTMARMRIWSLDSNKHIRRLSSEGGRPRLPWATKLQMFIDDPNPLFPILENLEDDPSKYVQKSVANCLNDILKDNPEVAKKIIEKWSIDATKDRIWIIKHALRNLRKKNDEWALSLINNF
ncbi:3-methyladenine DNA glycosylase [bacterium]|nr:DNA alkylation repair protein [Balneola sp.]MBR9918917.1 3-methyladenine DNA glycosylase [bacterium]